MQMTKLQCNLWNKIIVQKCSMIIIWVSKYTDSVGYPTIAYVTSSREEIEYYACLIAFVVYRQGDRKSKAIHYYKSKEVRERSHTR